MMAVAANVRKKLIEVSIPLEAINRESAREKSDHGRDIQLHAAHVVGAAAAWRRAGRSCSRSLSMTQAHAQKSFRPSEAQESRARSAASV